MWGRHEKEHDSADGLTGLPPESSSLKRLRGKVPQTRNDFNFTASNSPQEVINDLTRALKIEVSR